VPDYLGHAEVVSSEIVRMFDAHPECVVSVDVVAIYYHCGSRRLLKGSFLERDAADACRFYHLDIISRGHVS